MFVHELNSKIETDRLLTITFRRVFIQISANDNESFLYVVCSDVFHCNWISWTCQWFTNQHIPRDVVVFDASDFKTFKNKLSLLSDRWQNNSKPMSAREETVFFWLPWSLGVSRNKKMTPPQFDGCHAAPQVALDENAASRYACSSSIHW